MTTTMKRMIRARFAVMLALLAIVVSGSLSHTAYAASSGLTISPSSIDITVAPGATYKGSMLVLNQSELDTQYKVYATPYNVTGEDYQPFFTPIKGAVDITKWITLGSPGDTLKTGSQDTIPFTITVPPGTGAGGYYATIFAETQDKGSVGVVTYKRVGMIVYLRVSGKAIEKGSLDAWSVPLLQKAPFTATIKVGNEGSVHFQSKVHVVVSDLFGKPKLTYERAPEILPQKLRSIPVTWEKGATFGLFKVSGTVSNLGKTTKLPTKIVFIADTPMRWLMVGMILLFILVVVFLGKRRVATHKK